MSNIPSTDQTPSPSLEDLRAQIDNSQLPRHVAVIMDGNGRWAQERGQPRVFGHRSGVEAVDQTVEIAAELGIEYLTLYAFSTENWGRPQQEIDALMTLLVDTIRQEVPKLQRNRIRLQAIGDLTRLPKHSSETLLQAIEETSTNERMTLVLALNYSAKWEIIEAVRSIAQRAKQGYLEPEEINEDTFTNALSTSGMPDPELLIRTSGETRISNFLLWQLAYAELHFTEIFWPDFQKPNFVQAILDFQNRERRFGRTSSQIQEDKAAE